MLFHVIPDSYVVLRSRGVYRQAKLYKRDEKLYAGYGSGYIGLRRNNGTTAPNISWDYIEVAAAEKVEVVEEGGASPALVLRPPASLQPRLP